MTDAKLSLDKLWVLMVTAFVDMIGFALIVPLLPFYALEFGADAFVIGLLMAAFAFGQMVTAPHWGRASDRFGRKPVLIFAQGLSAAAFLTFAAADSVWLLFLSRFLQGVGGGSLGAVSAYVSDAVGPGERAKALGWITACTSAGVMVGPAIGSLTVGFSTAAPGLIAAGFCLLNMLFTWHWLEEARKVDRTAPKVRRTRIRGQLLEVLLHPLRNRANSLIWIYTAGMMAFMAMTGIMALYLESRFGVTAKNIGWFYVAVGAVSVVMRGLLLGKLVDRLGEVRVLRLGAVSLGLGMIGMTFAGNIWQFAAMLLLVPTGTALLFPCTTSLVTRYSRPDEVGQTVGVQQAFGGMSRLLAPVWSGAVFQALGEREPFWIGGALVFVTAMFALRLRPGEAPDHEVAAPITVDTET
ncbi:MAG: MFS transporter [Acidobacteriota bacterium]